MKRKEPKQTSPVQTKKGRSSIGEVGSPTALSVEEQKRRAKEWYENEEKKKSEASSAKVTTKSSRSKTPTTKTPSKKEKVEVEEEPVAPRSTRKSARTSETPSRSRTASARVEVEFIEDGEDDTESEEEEVVAPAPKVRKTSSAKVVKEEPVAPAVKTPRARTTAAKVPTPKLSPEPDSPPVSKEAIFEEERRKAKEWYEEQERKKAASTPKSASKPAAPRSATKPVKSATTTPNKPAVPVGHPTTSSASGAQCPFAFATEPERQPVPETHTINTHNTTPTNDCHQTCAVSLALAAIPLGAIAYYDPKIAVTTLVILFVASVTRRIFAMIADAEKNI